MAYPKEADPFYHTALWKRAAGSARDRTYGFCRECLKLWWAGKIDRPAPADVVHHIKPRKERPDLALAAINLEPLCHTCHNRRHPEKGFGSPGGRRQVKAQSSHGVKKGVRIL